MRRITVFLSFFALPVFLSILFMPRAAACQEDPPPDLRTLYLDSEVIVVGKIGTPGKWALSESAGPDNSRNYIRSIPIRVEEVIKGGSVNVAAVSETESEYLRNSRLRASVSEFYSSLAENKERRLFFLKKEGEAWFEISYGTDLEITPKQLAVFIPRLRELDNISTATVPSKVRLVEWFVAMAEDPVTRLEGAEEMVALLEEILMEEEAARDAAEEKKAREAEGDYDEEDEDEEAHLEVLSEADGTLIEAASFLRDRRVAERLLTELPAVSRADPDETVNLLTMLSRYYDDEKLDELTAKYENVAGGEENDLVPDRVPAPGEQAKRTPQRLPRETYGQRRAELVRQVLKLCRGLRAKK